MLKTKLAIVALTLSLSSIIHAQSDQTKKPQAYKFAEFQLIKSDALCEKVVGVYAAIRKDEHGQGFIINYGTSPAIQRRRKEIMRCITWRDYDAPRITFVDGPVEPKIKTVFWIVPAGADNPTP